MTKWHQTDPDVFGVALLDKPAGTTSFSALSLVKRACGTRKVGHTGTLDPFATGLLVALVGPATRTARFFNGLPKTYEAVFEFGIETDTDDCTGTPVIEKEAPEPQRVLDAAQEFIGEIMQVPPVYSAVHVDGERAHALARSGKQVELPQRSVTVHSLTIEHNYDSLYTVQMSCSAGTYVRSLARDLGRAADSAAHVTSLRRTRVGPFDVADAVPAFNFSPAELKPIADFLRELPSMTLVEVDRTTEECARLGKKLTIESLGCGMRTHEDAFVGLLHDTRLVAIGHCDPGHDTLVYDMVVPRETHG